MQTRWSALLSVLVVLRGSGWRAFWLQAGASAGAAMAEAAAAWRLAKRAASRGRFVWERDMVNLQKGLQAGSEEVPDGENPPRYIWCRGSL
jgi:hypothetical protein